MNIKQRQFFPGQPEAVPPVYVESMTLQEVRCFGEKQTLKFTKPDGSIAQWTVILGENGVGKTTVLQCLAGMQPVLRHEEKYTRDGKVYVRPQFRDGSQFPMLNHWHRPSSTLASHPLPDHSDWPWLKLQMNTRVGLSIESFYEGKASPKWYYCSAPSGKGPRLTANALRPLSDFAGLHFYAYGASRRMAVEGRKKFETTSGAESETLFGNENVLHNAVEWLEDLKLASAFEDGTESEKDRLQKEAAEKQLAEVLRLLPNVLPMVDEVSFRRDQNSKERAGFKFLTYYGWLSIESLSYGYQTMISWIVDFTRRMYDRYPDAKDPLAQPAIVLVDEIDLHLHPKWQRELMGFLSKRFPKTQFIVTAHSPLIIQSEEVANVILLQRDPNKPDQVIVRQDDVAEIRKWRLDQILTSDLYGLDSANAPDIKAKEARRSAILSKAKLTPKDEAELAEIEEVLSKLPAFSSREAVKAEQRFQATAALLEEAEKSVAKPKATKRKK